MALASPPHAYRPGDHLLVVHDFAARGDDELTLRRGEKIELVELDDGFGDGWYLGKDVKTGVTGLFPGVYTTRAPIVPDRPRTNDLEPDAIKTDGAGEPTADGEYIPPDTREPVSSPKSDDSTPHASRHASLTDLRGVHGPNDTGPSSLPPKQQQQRQQHQASSSPLSSTNMVVDIQRSIHQTLDPHMNGQDSPVMNETLSVIDEHITDLSTPRHSVKPSADQKTINDSASEYSSHLDHRMSYINGHETDEEEGNQPSEEQVRRWGVEETVKYLRGLGLEEKHCNIFEEQEITGDVLLDMNQDFIMMKEFDFGVMGRRLKTWHKIKAFQEEIKGYKEQQSSTARGSTAGFSTMSEERSMSRAGQTGPLRPRLPNYRGSFGGATQHPRLVSSSMQSDTSSPITPQTPSVPFMDHSRRPSAASIREMNHQRRHSSLDATSRYSTAGEASPHIGANHGKKSSFDRGWTMSLGAQRAPPRPGTALGASSSTAQHSNGVDSAMTDDLDRGYFSGPEVDTRTQRRVLQKRASVTGSAHSLVSNLTDEQLRANQRHSRISSIDSMTDATPPNVLNVGTTYPMPSPKGRLRSLSTRISAQQASRNAGHKGSSGGFFSSFAPRVGKSDPDSARPTPPLQQIKNAAPKFRRAVGFRGTSDTVSKSGDTSATPASPASPMYDVDPVSARTGSTTPSTSKSSERHSTDGSGKAAEGGILFPRARPSIKSGMKSKKDTSAYTRGLEKKTPQEQMEGCDFSGWMKKRSSNLMTTWKPRLFVLRGRRLSYYYSENDTEERGLIDITSHRVLRADNDPIVALHATITGATVTPTSLGGATTGESSISEKGSTSESTRGARSDKEGPFFFRLIPPKSSRTVQFTKPAVHYFQVDSVKEGRLWMAALMKATIERDISLPIESTNKQRTISLKEARLMNQRPPALMNEDQLPAENSSTEPTAAKDEEGTGLMIRGVSIDQVESPVEIDGPKRTSSPLGDIDTGSPSLLPNSIPKSG
ncbi:putative polarized growth protein (Boi2) [Aspergillus lucknowensis]|uniref:Polarized growth protein Boi2 n=1 Tax=Aspergillus lucknowensis TaxID=176173 RepID=A0ABR4LTW3_9EURO